VSHDHFDRVAGAYDESLPAHVREHYRGKRVRFIERLLRRGSVLDVGCGTGELTVAVAARGYRVVGLDRSHGMLGVFQGRTLRLIDRASYAMIKPHLSVGGSHFLVDMTLSALAQRLSVIEIPVNYRGRVGVSKITGTLRGTLTTGGRMIALIVGHRLRPRRGRPR